MHTYQVLSVIHNNQNNMNFASYLTISLLYLQCVFAIQENPPLKSIIDSSEPCYICAQNTSHTFTLYQNLDSTYYDSVTLNSTCFHKVGAYGLFCYRDHSNETYVIASCPISIMPPPQTSGDSSSGQQKFHGTCYVEILDTNDQRDGILVIYRDGRVVSMPTDKSPPSWTAKKYERLDLDKYNNTLPTLKYKIHKHISNLSTFEGKT